MLIADIYSPALHMRYEGPLYHYIRRELREDNLFVYFHRKTRNWIIAIWDDGKVGHQFREVICIGPSLEKADRHLVHELRYIWLGPPCNILKRLKEGERQRIRDLEAEEAEYDDAARFLAKREGTFENNPYWHTDKGPSRLEREQGPTKYSLQGTGYDPPEE